MANCESTNVQNSPTTLLKFIWIIIKNFPRSFLSGLKRNLIIGGSIALCVWVIHTYLMVGPNGGFAPSNPLFNNILALKGRVVSGTLFWTLLSGVFFTSFSLIKSTGISTFINSLKESIVKFLIMIKSLFKRQILGLPILTYFITGLVLGIILAIYLKNFPVYLLLILTIFLSLSQGSKSFWLVVIRLALSDIKRVFNLKKEIDLNIIYIVTYGIIAGLVIASILSKNILFLWIITFLFVGFSIFNITKKTGNSTLTLFLIAFLGTLLYSATRVYADDGGWQEAGGTWSNWVKSEGAVQAATMGTLPAVGSGIAATVVTSMQGMVDDVVTNVNDSVPPNDVTQEPQTSLENEQDELDRKKRELDEQIAREIRERDERQKKDKESAERYEKERQERIKRKELEKAELERARIEKEKEIKREELKRRQEQNIKEMEEANRSAWWWEKIAGTTEVIKKGCDVSVDLLSNVTGTPGKIIKHSYTVASKMGEGVGEYMVDGKDLGTKLGEKIADGASGVAEDLIGGKYGDKAKAMVTVTKNVIKKTYNEGLSIENIGSGMLDGVKEVTVDQVAGKICDKIPGLSNHEINVDYKDMKAKDFINLALKKDESIVQSVQNTIRGEIGNQAKNTDNQKIAVDYALKKAGY